MFVCSCSENRPLVFACVRFYIVKIILLYQWAAQNKDLSYVVENGRMGMVLVLLLFNVGEVIISHYYFIRKGELFAEKRIFAPKVGRRLL